MKTALYILTCSFSIALLTPSSEGAPEQEKNAQGEVAKPSEGAGGVWHRQRACLKPRGAGGLHHNIAESFGSWWSGKRRQHLRREPSHPLLSQHKALAEHVLPPPLDGATRRGIPNLGATCYLNSFFKYMAYNHLFGSVLNRPLRRQEGESQRLFAARQAVQKSLKLVRRYLQSKPHKLREEALPVPFIETFISTWNHLYLAEQQSDHKLSGVQFALAAHRQEDTAYLIRVLHNALAYPKISIIETLTAVHPHSKQPIAELTVKEKAVASPGSIDLTLGVYKRCDLVSMQGLVDATFGPSASDYVDGLQTWQQAGESATAQVAQKAMYLKPATPSVTFIINDRIYPDYNRPGLGGFYNKKNQARLQLDPIIEVATLDVHGQRSRQKMRLRSVVVHSGGAYGGHYKLISYERDHDGRDYWVTHDDARIHLGADTAGMQRGVRALHYELLHPEAEETT